MNIIFSLACKSAWARRFTLCIVVLSIALSTALLLGVERVRVDARSSFSQSVAGVDLIVGAPAGSVQLLLASVFHQGNVQQNIQMQSYRKIAAHPSVAWSAPMSLGDSHRGFAVLGTTLDYFEHWRYGQQQTLQLSYGRHFGASLDTVFEAVLGHSVAKELGYTLGQKITLAHGSDALGAMHDDKPFTVVGILAPTGTPVDRTVHVSLEAITALHLDWQGGASLPGFKIAPELVRKFDLQPREITAIAIGLKNRTEVFRLQRAIQTVSPEPLLAVMPGVALDELWQTLKYLEASLLAISALVALAGLTGLMATFLAGLNERRREMAILQSLGAGLRHLFALLLMEGLLITLLGIALGVALLTLAITLLGPVMQAELGILIRLRPLSGSELALVGAILAAGLLASLLPAWRAQRLALSDGLTPQY